VHVFSLEVIVSVPARGGTGGHGGVEWMARSGTYKYDHSTVAGKEEHALHDARCEAENIRKLSWDIQT